MERILVCIQGEANDIRTSFPEDEVIQLNYLKLSDLNFTSYNNEGAIVSQFTLNNCLAVKICTPEAIIQMDSMNKQFTIQCIITPTDQSILVSTQDNNVITVHPLDQMLATYKAFLETIPEEQEESLFDRSPQRLRQLSAELMKNNNLLRVIDQNKKKQQNQDQENQKFKSNRKMSTPKKKQSPYKKSSPKKVLGGSPPKKGSPQKKGSPLKRGSPQKKGSPSKSPARKKTIEQSNRTKRTTNKLNSMSALTSSPMRKENSSPNRKGKENQKDYVDNNKKNRTKKRRPSTAFPLRPKIDSEGMIDRQWLEEEMINENL